MKRTVNALMARGVDLQLAERIAGNGWLLSKLQQAPEDELSGLGLPKDAIQNIIRGARPPIPEETVANVLYRNRFQCCVCRDPERSIILHHIKPWAESRDHGEANLAVLCLQHHAQAHITTTLAQNLDQASLASFKEKWEAECERLDAEAILKASRLDHAAWLYFNHQRILALADDLNVIFPAMPGYSSAVSVGLVNPDGAPVTGQNDQSYMYHGGNGRLLYAYMRDVLHTIMRRLTIVNLSDYLDRSSAKAFVAPGDFLFVQGAHVFKKQNEQEDGPGQISSGVRQAHGVVIKYVFDRWEATSTSAWGAWLLGRQSVGSLVHVKSLEREEGKLVILGTVLAISNGHSILKDRDYAQEVGRLAAERLRFDEDTAGWDSDD